MLAHGNILNRLPQHKMY